MKSIFVYCIWCAINSIYIMNIMVKFLNKKITKILINEGLSWIKEGSNKNSQES